MTLVNRMQQICWDLAPRGGLPAGRLSLLVGPAADGALRVEVACVTVSGRDTMAARNDAYDDGRIVVDRDAGGRVHSVELLASKDPWDLPEFCAATAREALEPDLLTAMHATAFGAWMRVGSWLGTRRADGTAVPESDLRDLAERTGMTTGAERTSAGARDPSRDPRRWHSGPLRPERAPC